MAAAENGSRPGGGGTRRGRRALVWAGPALLAIAGLTWFLLSGRYVASDNAYVKADIIEVAPRIDGTVLEVPVASDARVRAGEVLLRLDDAEARLAVARAEAELAAELNELESLRLQASAAEAALAAARARLEYRTREVRRLEGLTATGIASRVSYDAAVEEAASARDEVTIAGRELRELDARLGGDPARPAAQHPRVLLRQAALEEARLRLGYTVIRASRDAQAGTISVFPGEQVGAGQVLLSLVGNARPCSTSTSLRPSSWYAPRTTCSGLRAAAACCSCPRPTESMAAARSPVPPMLPPRPA